MSLGYHNIQEDCDKWVLFLQSHYLNHAPPILGMPNVLATHESENSSCVSSSVSVSNHIKLCSYYLTVMLCLS